MPSKPQKPPPSLTFQGLRYIENRASGSPFHSQLADNICHGNKDGWRLPPRRCAIKASVMRSDESREVSNAVKGRFSPRGDGETPGWVTLNFPAPTSGDVLIFSLILHITPVMSFFFFLVRSAQGCCRTRLFQLLLSIRVCIFNSHTCHIHFSSVISALHQCCGVLTHVNVSFFSTR